MGNIGYAFSFKKQLWTVQTYSFFSFFIFIYLFLFVVNFVIHWNETAIGLHVFPIAALFIIARTWKQPRCPSADEWMGKLWYIYTMEYYSNLLLYLGRVCSLVKNLLAIARAIGDVGLIPGLGRFLWKRKWQPAPVFLPEKSHWQRKLAGYSLWGYKRVRHNWAHMHIKINNITITHVPIT